MHTRAFVLATSLAALPLSISAQTQGDPVLELFEAMQLDAIVEVMQEEGVGYGKSIGDDLIPGGGDARWVGVVERIYDADRMNAELVASLTAELDGADVGAMVSFFENEPGATIIELEVAARRALLDPDLEDAAAEIAALAIADETPRYLQIERYVDANDLIETNIVGAMNSNFAFYTGLVNGGGMTGDVSEDQILSDVWSQEPEIRQSTVEWVYSFLLLAYEPLEDADLETYIAFSETDAGQDLNAALFVAFDGMFESISRNLGLGAAQFMGQQDL